jgi:hypothetical protein
MVDFIIRKKIETRWGKKNIYITFTDKNKLGERSEMGSF